MSYQAFILLNRAILLNFLGHLFSPLCELFSKYQLKVSENIIHSNPLILILSYKFCLSLQFFFPQPHLLTLLMNMKENLYQNHDLKLCKLLPYNWLTISKIKANSQF